MAIAPRAMRFLRLPRVGGVDLSVTCRVVDLIRQHAEWWDRYVLGDSTGRPLAAPETLDVLRVSDVALTIGSKPWRLRTIRLNVPSEHLAENGITVRPNGVPQRRFVASSKPASEDKWRTYRLTRDELPGALLAVVAALEPEISDEEATVVEDDGDDSSALAEGTS